MPPLQGSVYGGHAPLVGAKVYILTPSTTALYGQSISLMAGDSQNSALVPAGTGNGTVSAGGTNGFHYLTTDLNGAYNLTGDYACTVNQPVYLVAVGGTPTYPSGSNLFSISSVAVTNSNNVSTVTLTTTTTENAYIGEQATFAGFTGSLATLNSSTATITATNLTTTTFSYQTTGLTTGTYAQSTPYPTATLIPTVNSSAVNMTALGLCPAKGSFAGAISYIYTNEVSTAAMAVATAAFGSGPFNIGVQTGGPIDAHYANYDLNGLSQALNNAGLLYDITGGNISTTYAGEGHIARSITPAGNGIVPQALMDTWGNILAACVDSNNTGTGSVSSPQCDTLFSNATSTGIACTVSSGTITCPSGTTAPTDIATAAFNMAHYPGGTATTVGTNPGFVNNLYTLPTGNLPFAPNLVSNGSGQPNDFSVSLVFTAPSTSGGTNNLISAPQVIAINGGNYIGNESGYTGDANGELQESVWIGNYASQAVKLFANGGAPDYTTNAALGTDGTVNMRSVAMDAAENVWMVAQNSASVREFSATGSTLLTFSPATGQGDHVSNGLDAVIDGIGTNYNVYVAGYSDNNILKLGVVNGTTPSVTNLQTNDVSGNAAFSTSTATTGSGTAACDVYAATLAFAPGTTPTLFMSSDSSATAFGTDTSYTCTIDTTTGAQVTSPGTGSGFFYQNVGEGPATVAIDSAGTAWVGGGQTTAGVSQGVRSITAAGVLEAYTGAGMNDPCGVAVDGSNHIWVGNAAIYGVSELTNAGVAMSPVANTGAYANALGGYNPQFKNTYTMNGVTVFAPAGIASNCGSPAIDRAGDVWVAYQGSGAYSPGVIFEILGIASPVVTPRAYATFGNGTTGFLGKRPY